MLPDLSSIMLCYWQSWFISFIILFKQGYFVFSICPLCLVVLLLVKHTTWYLESLFRVWNFWSIWRYIFLLLTEILKLMKGFLLIVKLCLFSVLLKFSVIVILDQCESIYYPPPTFLNISFFHWIHWWLLFPSELCGILTTLNDNYSIWHVLDLTLPSSSRLLVLCTFLTISLN